MAISGHLERAAITSAFPPKADINSGCPEGPLMTQSGHAGPGIVVCFDPNSEQTGTYPSVLTYPVACIEDQ